MPPRRIQFAGLYVWITGQPFEISDESASAASHTLGQTCYTTDE